MPTLDRDSISLFGGSGEPLGYLRRAQTSFERKQGIKVQKVTSGLAYPLRCFIYFWGRGAGLQ